MNRNPNPSSCHEPVIDLQDVTVQYGGRLVLNGVTFQVRQRDFVGLIASNGAGKTTLLKTIVGLLQPASGSVKLFGTPVDRFKDWERIGYVPQKNNLNPLFPATVREVVMSGLYGRKRLFRRIGAAERRRAEQALEALGIADIAERRIGQLSGGQQQRVFLARAIAGNPELLILDEPTVGIDMETQRAFFHMLRHMHERHRLTFLIVSHDVEMLQAYLGEKPAHTHDRLRFYVKHSHSLEDCGEDDISHGLLQEKERLTVGHLV